MLPGSAAHITIKEGTIPIASQIDDAALRHDIPGLLRLPLEAGIAESVAVFTALKAEGRLTV